MDWFAKSVNLGYFPSKDGPLKDKWVRIRGVAERIGLSPKAKEKLEWIIFYHTVGDRNVQATSCYGQRRVIFTALEDTTKIAFARVYKTNSSNFSKDFLLRLVCLVDGKVNYIHSDNGAEFEGSFSEACRDLALSQIYSRPHTPKDNPALERFNWTVQDEWLSLSEVGLDDLREANEDLTHWLIEYNNLRPHQTLDYQTPLEYAQDNYFKVLPMWSARTVG